MGSDCESGSRSLLLERHQVEHALLIKARTGQTSVRGVLEAATCAILALDMPTRIDTDCEWVKKGIKENPQCDGEGRNAKQKKTP